MANIPKGLLAGSDPAIKTGAYGPNMAVLVADGIAVLTTGFGAGKTIATYNGIGNSNGYTIDPATLDPATVPYVNAFVRDYGAVDKYWRTGLYRFRPVGGCNVETIAGVWVVTGVPVPGTLNTTSVQAQPVAPVAAPKVPSLGDSDVDRLINMKNGGLISPQDVLNAISGAPTTIDAMQKAFKPVPTTSFKPMPLPKTVRTTVIGTKPVLPPATFIGFDLANDVDDIPEPEVIIEAPKPIERIDKTNGIGRLTGKGGLKAPEGYTIITGRTGELVVPERTLATFAAAARCRFDDGLPAHILVIGPAGTGKTESVLALAVAHGMEVAGIVACGGIEGPSDLYGQTTPDETAPHGWRRLPSALWRALDTARCNPDKRYFVLLDEVNRMGTLAAQNALLGMLDGTESLANPATGEAIPLPSNLMVAATANIGIAYSGTVRMDAALMSRWFTNLSFGYLPENVEAAICTAITGDAVQARYIARAAFELRQKHALDEFRSALIPGTREVVAVAHQSKYDLDGAAGAWHDKITCSFSNEGRDASRTEYARVRVISEGVFKNTLPDRDDDSNIPF